MAAPRARPEVRTAPIAFGKYSLVEQVAHGRLSSVHRALLRRERQADEPYAIKRFTRELSRDPRFAERATRVLSRAAQVEHPAHCRIADVDRADETLYAALEWIAGRDLRRVSLALRDGGRMMPPALVAYIGSQVAEVLAEAHALTRSGKRAPLLHGELSPTDILIGFDGRVHVIGLGSAELAVMAQVPATRLPYQAPELGEGAACSEQSDVFSLGACMLKVLSQRAATESVGAVQRADSHITQIIPRALKQIVDRSLAMRPQARWQSADELADELNSWRSAQSQPADADALATFMRGLFDSAEERAEQLSSRATLPDAIEPVRHAPWDGAAEHTPPNGTLMQQLAASMAVQEQAGEAPPSPPSPPSAPEPRSTPPEPQARTEAASEGWEDDPWDEEASRRWIASATARASATLPQQRPPVHAPSPVPASDVRVQPSPVPAPMLTTSAPAPAILDAWHAEERRHKPWLMPLLIAGAALAVVLAFALRGEDASNAEPLASAATATPPPPSAAAVTAGTAAPQPAAIPSPVELQAVPAVGRHTNDAPRARERSRRERAQPSSARPQPDEEVEVAPAPEEVEPPEAPAIAATEAAAAETASPVPNEAATTAIAPPTVEPSPRPAAQAPAPPVTRGPTRAARAIKQVPPRFPMRAKRIGIEQGTVTLDFKVDKSGAVKDAVVVAAEPPRIFEEAALKAVSQWRYEPKLVDGTPTEARVRFTFHFK